MFEVRREGGGEESSDEEDSSRNTFWKSAELSCAKGHPGVFQERAEVRMQEEVWPGPESKPAVLSRSHSKSYPSGRYYYNDASFTHKKMGT